MRALQPLFGPPPCVVRIVAPVVAAREVVGVFSVLVDHHFERLARRLRKPFDLARLFAMAIEAAVVVRVSTTNQHR